MNKVLSTSGLVLASVLLLTGCTGDDQTGTTSDSTASTITLDSPVSIAGSLKTVLDESKIPDGWRVAQLEAGPGMIEPEEGTAVDLESVDGSCFFYARTDPEVVQTSQVSMGDSFLTLSTFTSFLTVENESSTAEMKDPVSISTADGDSVEIAVGERFEEPFISEMPTESGEIQEVEVAGQNQMLGKRIFAVNAEDYTIPEEAVTEEMKSMPAPKLSSLPALTVVLSCQSKEDVKVETYEKLVGALSIENIKRSS